MRKVLVVAIASLFVTAGLAGAEEPKSGLELGGFPSAFNVKDITGPKKGTSLCYRCAYGARPVVAIFTREVNEDVANLVKQIDNVVGENKEQKMSAFVILLSDDPDADEAKLAKVAEQMKIQNVPLTIFDGVAGPPEYKISKDAAVNVMMWVKQDVKANQAFAQPKLDKETTAKIVADTKKILE